MIPWYLMAKGKGGGGYKTASGPIISVNDALAAPLRSLVANIEPVQDLHGYDNPWPAGGGVNKWDEEWEIGAYNVSTGEKSSDGARIRNKNFIAVTGGQSYYLSLPYKIGTYGAYLFKYDSSQAYISGGQIYNGLISLESNVAYINFCTQPSYGTTYNNDISVNYPATDTAYYPYSNECPISGWSTINVWVKPTYDPTANPTATLQLGQTVYGGTLDVTNGVLTVDRVADTFTKDSAWYGFATGSGNLSAVVQLSMYQNCKYVDGSASYNGSISSTGVEAPNYWVGARQNEVPTQGDMCFAYSQTGQLRFHRLDVSNITDLESFKAAFPDTVVCYYLATPITIPLTPTEISTLQGQNNVWADSGDVMIEYLSSGGANADLMKLAVAFMGRK